MQRYATIYWGLLEPEPLGSEGLLSAVHLWKPWFSLVHPYRAPLDPLHVTMFYDRGQDLTYAIDFLNIEGQQHTLTATHIFVHAQGVVAVVKLPRELEYYYRQDHDSIPHVTCLLGAGTEARELGPLAKHLNL